MLDQLAVTTDNDGRCTLDGFTPAEILGLDVTARGQLVQCLPIDPDTGTVTLRPLGRLKVRVVADDPKAVRGWTITAWSRPAEPGYRGPYTTHWVRETTGEDGRVEFQPIAQGQVDWEIKAPEGTNYLVTKHPGRQSGRAKRKRWRSRSSALCGLKEPSSRNPAAHRFPASRSISTR